ncbi:MAG: L-serine ammonia-lyase [Solidesulfovibrio sp.]|uniref:L-serine ammonia-lyase n=1 Tax=Solidesulfovibrio sp. TaxID=2910990 RepID=UPI0031586F1E
MPAIDLSVFDLFKIGPGPSSSHTIGPMRAGADFLGFVRGLPPQALAAAGRIAVTLYGSLAATGRGHGTDRAVLAGLLGELPERCPPDFLDGLARDPDKPRRLDLGPTALEVSARDVTFGPVAHDLGCPNTLRLQLLGRGEPAPVLAERLYCSVGGGFVRVVGAPDTPRPAPVHAYETMADIKRIVAEHDIGLTKLLLENEAAISGLGRSAILAGLDGVLSAMDAAVAAGLATSGLLPGPLGLARKAATLFERAGRSRRQPHESHLAKLMAYAFAAAEENAAGHVVVTAPTCGASGILPATARFMRQHLELPEHSIREGLLAAAAVGFLAKHNATIAGAEGGCQAEVGVAAAMAAAMLAHGAGFGVRVVENAAETALEHHLGLTCDPVGGYVQIPCIERNAIGAVKAYAAYLIASDEMLAHHKVGLDQAIAAMRATGRDMHCNYKETAQGGLALSVITC